MASMNIRRVFVFALALLALRVAVSFVAAGIPAENEAGAQLIIQYFSAYVLDAIAVVAVIARLAKVQLQSTFLHVFLVVLLQELLGAAFLSLMGWSNPRSPLWLLDWIVLAAAALLGFWVGRRLRAEVSS
ncbi:hypothetical protein PRJ39_09195 [Lysobacter enzymogenes]|uniref:hypothetical protein n=1 Tax=Lysobacter enzymogenes TaxID=69 RepID=UPI00374A0AD9